jgi:hypothetical protein
MRALRELLATSSGATPPTTLFTPAGAVRVRFSNYTDTPLPADEPMAPNPPDGAPIDYFLAAPARSVTLEILEAGGGLVRRYQGTETDQIVPRDTGNVPWYWVRPPQTLETSPGAHRVVWDLRYPTPPFPSRDFPISAVPGRTPLEPRGPLLPPGRYSVRLIVDGVGYTRQFDVRMDPRVKTPVEALNVQFVAAVALAEGLRRDSVALGEVRASKQHARPTAVDTVGAGLAQIAGELQALYEIVEAADVAPTTQAQAAIRERLSTLDALLARWSAIRGRPR